MTIQAHTSASRGIAFASLLGMAVIAGAGAHAAAPTASSSAYDLQVNVSVLGGTVLNVMPVDQVQFTNQATSYVDEQTTPSFDSGNPLGTVARLQTGMLDAQTQWLPGASFLAVGAQATADDVNLSAVSLADASLLSLQASVIQGTAIVSGSCPPSSGARLASAVHLVDDYIFRNGFEAENLQATSSATLDGSGGGIVLSLLNSTIANIPANPAPNTSIDLSGISGTNSLILNEQTISGDGITARGVISNALHLSLNVAGVITADVIISHAQAAVDCN